MGIIENTVDINDSTILSLVEDYEMIKKVKKIKKVGLNLERYKDIMGRMESNNNYLATNQYGYLGKYQFSKKTLSGLGFDKEEIESFLESPSIQERAMNELVDHNIGVLKNYGLMKYIGQERHGVTITLDGMLASAHLCGPWAVCKFIKHGEISYDGNNTSLVLYMGAFS